MDNFWMAITALLIFVTFIFLYWKLTREYGKNEFGSKLWKHWPTDFLIGKALSYIV